jgi:Periplasmic glycine betaine/choline-binding (lipo)protein of an ABC-type transport system (osmoprotectant binding protein)
MRALMLSPELLLLDEPFAALDPLVRVNLQRDLKEICAQLQQTVLVVTHDLPEAAFLANDIVLVNGGRIVQRGSIADLRAKPANEFAREFIQRATEPDYVMKQAFPRNGDFQIADLSKRRCKDRPLLISLLLLVSTVVTVPADPIIIGSKKFTESYVLAEIAKRSLENAGIKADQRQGMGGTIILWEALRGGGIDVYPEYTGTIAEEVLKQPGVSTTQIRNALSAQGIGMTEDLGFNNTYALVMRRDHADQLAIKTISDLRTHPELKFRVNP